MPGVTVVDDSAIRVVVTPSQSAYFAGETFSVTITFTNTRSPEYVPPRPHLHKRGAHSISSAPLARPPTSPGTPRTVPQPLAYPPRRKVESPPHRRGLIGRHIPSTAKGVAAIHSEALPDLIEQRRKRLLGKSISVSLAPHELEAQLEEARVTPSTSFESHFPSLPLPHISSPMARSDKLSLSSDHPHARKHSVLDGSNPEVLITSVSKNTITPSASTSSFSLALDPIAEGGLSPSASTPSLSSPLIEVPPGPSFSSRNNPSTTAHPYSSAAAPLFSQPPRRASEPLNGLGLGYPGQPPLGKLPRTAFPSTFPNPNTPELILYSYAQLKGTLSLVPPTGVQQTLVQQHTLNATRAKLLKRRAVVGGGSMDITSSLHSPPVSSTALQSRLAPHGWQAHARSSSLSAGLFSFLPPMSLVGRSAPVSPVVQTSTLPHSPRRTSISGSSSEPQPSLSAAAHGYLNGIAPGSGISGLGLLSLDGGQEEEIDEDIPLPTFEVPPAMLAVDLALIPGESRSYTYSVLLPDNLAPTFKGRSLRFSYELEVGTCRATSYGPGSTSANSVSRVMKVPIRLYNHVSVKRPIVPYDILWPFFKPPPNSSCSHGLGYEQGKVVEETVSTKKGDRFVGKPGLTPSSSTSALTGEAGMDDLRSYAHRLLAIAAANRKNKPISDPFSYCPSSLPNGNSGNSHGIALGLEKNEQSEEEAEEHRQRLQQELEWIEQEDRATEGASGLTGCREAVEILTRNSKKVSYDVNKDGVKVATLTFTKAAYRLGETVLGVVEINERQGRARVLQLSAMLEAHESLPSAFVTSHPATKRQLKRIHAEHHSSFTLNTLRTTFALDIPSDATPAFEMCVRSSGDDDVYLGNGAVGNGSPIVPAAGSNGGLEWKVRLCLLVAVADEEARTGPEGVRFKSMVRDGPREEWASCWKATKSITPLQKLPDPSRSIGVDGAEDKTIKSKTWGELFASAVSLLAGEEDGERMIEGLRVRDEDEGYDGIKPDMAGGVGKGINFGGGDAGWSDVKAEMVECEVPVRVWPGNTAFRPADVVFGL